MEKSTLHNWHLVSQLFFIMRLKLANNFELKIIALNFMLSWYLKLDSLRMCRVPGGVSSVWGVQLLILCQSEPHQLQSQLLIWRGVTAVKNLKVPCGY